MKKVSLYKRKGYKRRFVEQNGLSFKETKTTPFCSLTECYRFVIVSQYRSISIPIRPKEGNGGLAGAGTAAASAYISYLTMKTSDMLLKGLNVDLAYSYNDGFSGSIGWGPVDKNSKIGWNMGVSYSRRDGYGVMGGLTLPMTSNTVVDDFGNSTTSGLGLGLSASTSQHGGSTFGASLEYSESSSTKTGADRYNYNMCRSPKLKNQ